MLAFEAGLVCCYEANRGAHAVITGSSSSDQSTRTRSSLFISFSCKGDPLLSRFFEFRCFKPFFKFTRSLKSDVTSTGSSMTTRMPAVSQKCPRGKRCRKTAGFLGKYHGACAAKTGKSTPHEFAATHLVMLDKRPYVCVGHFLFPSNGRRRRLPPLPL